MRARPWSWGFALALLSCTDLSGHGVDAVQFGIKLARPRIPVSTPRPQCGRSSPAVMAQGSSEPDIADRALASLVYLLPLLDGFPYGIYIYRAVPPVGDLAYQFLPVVNAFQSVS